MTMKLHSQRILDYVATAKCVSGCSSSDQDPFVEICWDSENF